MKIQYFINRFSKLLLNCAKSILTCMKSVILTAFTCCLFFLLISPANAQQSIVKLSWKLAPKNDALYTSDQVSTDGFITKDWINAVVPGTVFYSYVAAGKEKNPDYAENIYKVDTARYNRPFWYRTEFSGAALPAGKRIWLNFAGINKRGEIYMNGHHIGTVDGLMQTEKYDITGLLTKTGINAIAVLVFTPNTSHGLANRESPTYLSSGSWDWMPSVPGLNSGITDLVTITATGPVVIEDPWIHTALPSKSLANLAVSLKLKNSIGKPVTGKVKVVIQPGNIVVTTSEITLTANSSQSLELAKDKYPQLAIKDPKLWWPNGYGGKADGTQYMYSCTIQFETGGNKPSDVVEKSFGIRKITADTTALNGPVRVYVNDVPIMIKGGNWGMSDYMLKVRGKDYETRIKFHQEMNFNMIRNWTGEVTDDAFYDYCDKYGMMVWDDFWLNNFGPIDSLAVFKSNAIAKVKRLRNHPSVVIWCGANEGVPGGDPNGPLNTAIKEVIATNDGEDRLYFPRSNAGVNNPNFSIHGGSRILSGSGIWANVDPKTYFTDPHNGYLFSKDNYGLRSELGSAAFVNVESFKKFMPKDYWVAPTPEAVNSKTNMWARHYFSTDGALGGGSNPVKYINDINNQYGKATSLEDFCRKAQLLNVEVTKAMYEAWNDHMWNNASGMLMWMSQSAYPSMIWQTYDYYYDLTGAYFGAKTACEPVHIQWNPATNAVKVINNKPYDIKGLTAQAEVYNMDGKIVAGYTQKITMDVSATAAANAFTVFTNNPDSSKLSAVHFLKLKLMDAKGQLLSDNFYWVGNTYLDYTALSKMLPVTESLKVSPLKISAAANGINRLLTYVVTNNSQTTAAFAIRAQLLNAKGEQMLPAFFNCGYFSLMQGESKTLIVEVDPKLLGNAYKLDLKAYNN
jgi:hypothetical protein